MAEDGQEVVAIALVQEETDRLSSQPARKVQRTGYGERFTGWQQSQKIRIKQILTVILILTKLL